MARPKTDAWYRERVAQYVPRLKGARLLQAIEQDAAREGRTDEMPSASTIERLRKAALQQAEKVKLEQEEFHWPQSMEFAGIPWEASRIALDLLRELDAAGVRRPSVRLVKWFWRIRQAAPGISLGDAHYLAAALAVYEYAKLAGIGELELADIDRQLAYEPWLSEENLAAYVEASRRNGLPAFSEWTVTGDEAAIQKKWAEILRSN